MARESYGIMVIIGGCLIKGRETDTLIAFGGWSNPFHRRAVWIGGVGRLLCWGSFRQVRRIQEAIAMCRADVGGIAVSMQDVI